MIPLVEDTIDKQDIDNLVAWLQTNPRLTKGDCTKQFEKKWAEYIGVKHSLYVSSGSTANLGIIYSLILSGKMKNKKVVVPAVSWSTTVAPVIQFGLEPILCDASSDDLGLDINHLEKICKEEKPAAIMLVHVLGMPCNLEKIMSLCQEHDILLIEDCCESIGSTYENKKIGSFGLVSSFSFYFGHHISTIEGGMICTDDEELYNIMCAIRSHGWDRDLPESKQKELRQTYGIDDFRALYTFYYPAFNLRATDLQAFIGLRQMEKINDICFKRNKNFELYDSLIKNDYWKPNLSKKMWVSNHAYPVITPNIKELAAALKSANVESRPLICGSIGKQPFWIKKYGETNLNFADVIHDYGLYLPNNHQITKEQIEFACNIVNFYTS
jgi:CDP-6-deoxy-D-xylo-4-hexulose-3-dehydrase|tara:strand:- start:894 stop:2045 length:1152 start_codon:yes stop_codon:yes gene_type:complete